MKPTASLIRALIASAMALSPWLAGAQETRDAPSKPVLASTYVAPPVAAAPTSAVPPVASPVSAPDAAPAPSRASATRSGIVPLESPPDAGEPDVKYIVIESDGTRIEELRVRGVSQRLTVQTRLGPKEGYEIIMGDGSRDLSPGANTSRGATGQRVWHVLSF